MPAENPKAYFETDIPAKMQNNPNASKEINAVYQFDITGPMGGTWTVDLTKTPGEVRPGADASAKCTVTCADQDFMKIVNKQLNPQMAFMSGKLKIKGDMGLAMKLTKVIG